MAVCFPQDPGKPPERETGTYDGPVFFLYFIPRRGHSFNIKPSGLITYRLDANADNNRSYDSGNSYRRTHMFLSVCEKPLHPINTA